MSGEPRAWTLARREKLAAIYPELGLADAQTVMGVDELRSTRGEPPSAFSQAVMRLAAAAGEGEGA